MGNIILLLFITAVVNLFPPVESARSHYGARFYRGEIRVSTEWEGTIRVTGKVTVKSGVTLTVAPGTRVLVSGGEDVRIVVEGKLFIRGLAEMKVTFEPADGCGNGPPWGGIYFSEGSAGILEGADIKCSKKGVWGELAGVTMIGVVTDNES
ncbi:MAG: hypothetical protein GTO08_03055 [Deltaproteobacteria bacterium]|nr:hypothetical protein [Deltaproteobacteria bacterium]